MNTRILASLMVIGLVASAIGMGTYAYFSDTETSTGNTFTAGSINLKLDKNGEWFDGENMQIFNLEDIKPGDSGEETISIHVEENDAWLCLYIKESESENGCVEPEIEAEPDCETCPGDGELDENLHVFIWWDDGSKDGYQCPQPMCSEDPEEGDNVYQDGEMVFFDGLAKDLPDPSEWTEQGPWPIEGCQPVYMGIKWDLPPEVGNEAQTDQVTVDACFYAVQMKNNPDFNCPTTAPDTCWSVGG